ncbi:MAG: multicopper oxidase domain-containing protein [Firmicutes bacterium]|uniref:Copper-containing nitrite reductase n=1 Tax=Melghirimyces thermohalophilus TaxID=1236220 RepID=A0A1G6PQR5_9BACL|nr:multicopper oxidase domain-containing protein [Melghirimyces thermohalophilus]MDA8352311.1 multicopper oxidase domain-containing protein [Bacillota bacterium]SDC81826.1 nitrite reductase (NO-forming) [Melghirimyces thermohalophilus]
MKGKVLIALGLLIIWALVWVSSDWIEERIPPSEEPSKSSQKEQEHPKPVPVEISRDGKDVHVKLTAQQQRIQIAKGVEYPAWTFNGTVPGPVLKVREGDRLHLQLKNMDSKMNHSVDIHAVNAAPDKHFADVQPGKTDEFEYEVEDPGVYMYHCATTPMMEHVANGMYGMIIVEPKEGYPTDQAVDRTFTLTQSEWYKGRDMEEDRPKYVAFNGVAHKYDAARPLKAKAGERIRIYFVNAGPNEMSSLHVVGTTLDRVYVDGDPRNSLNGVQTVTVSPGGGTVVEFEVDEPGEYTIISHQLNQFSKGAKAILKVTR